MNTVIPILIRIIITLHNTNLENKNPERNSVNNKMKQSMISIRNERMPAKS